MNLRLLLIVAVIGCLAPFAAAGEPSAPSKVTELTLTRSGDGNGTGPEDVLTLRSDGTASYVGTKNVEHIGSYTGTIPLHGFEPSFPLLAAIYESIRGQPGSTGKPTQGVTAVAWRVVRDEKAEEIDDLCPGLDRTLWAFEMAVRGVASDIQWKKAVPPDAGIVEPQRNKQMDEANPPQVELVAWGEEKAGVKAGLGFEENTKTGKHVAEIGKPFKLVVKLRNTGKAVAEGSYSEGTYFDQLPKVVDEDGKSVAVIQPPPPLGGWRLVNYSLKRDEELTISTVGIVFVRLTPHGQVRLPTVVAEPGRYRISFEGTGRVEVQITPKAP